MPMPPNDAFASTIQQGFATIDGKLKALIVAMSTMLEQIGEPECAALLRGEHDDECLPESGVDALSIYFQLLNLTEEYAANATRRKREQTMGYSAEPGSFGHYLERLAEAGIPHDAVASALETVYVEPVFTKHPTESKRWPVLGIHREMHRLLGRLDTEGTVYESERVEHEIQAILERLWRTGEVFVKKPDVADELDNLLFYLLEILPDAAVGMDERLHYAWRHSPYGGEAGPGGTNLAFGSWVGGDRDGHPLVTAEVTREALAKLCQGARRILDRELAELERSMRFSKAAQDIPHELRAALGANETEQLPEEPWRVFIAGMRKRLMGQGGVDAEDRKEPQVQHHRHQDDEEPAAARPAPYRVPKPVLSLVAHRGGSLAPCDGAWLWRLRGLWIDVKRILFDADLSEEIEDLDHLAVGDAVVGGDDGLHLLAFFADDGDQRRLELGHGHLFAVEIELLFVLGVFGPDRDGHGR